MVDAVPGATGPDRRAALRGRLADRLADGPADRPVSPGLTPGGDQHEPFPLTALQAAYWVGRSAPDGTDGTACHGYLELELYWHNEDAFNAVWPRLIAFACARPADEGGETTVVDGCAVAAGLRPESLRRFRDDGVRYVRRFLPGLGLHWSAVFGTDDRVEVTARCAADGAVAQWDGDLLTTSCVRPAVLRADDGALAWFAQILHWHPHCLDPVVREQMTAGTDGALPREVAFGDGSPIPVDVVDEVIALSRSSEYPVGWQRGDLLLVDNARTAHGRRTYQGERRIMVSMGEPTPSIGR